MFQIAVRRPHVTLDLNHVTQIRKVQPTLFLPAQVCRFQASSYKYYTHAYRVSNGKIIYHNGNTHTPNGRRKTLDLSCVMFQKKLSFSFLIDF